MMLPNSVDSRLFKKGNLMPIELNETLVIGISATVHFPISETQAYSANYI